MDHYSRRQRSCETTKTIPSMTFFLKREQRKFLQQARNDHGIVRARAPDVPRARRRSRWSASLPLWVAVIGISTMSRPSVAFVSYQCSVSSTLPSQRRQTRSLPMSFQEVSDFYQNFPIQSAILTCGFKASLADSLAQLNDSLALSSSTLKEKMKKNVKQLHKQKLEDDSFNWEYRRNLAYVIYGGFFVGLMCHIEYNILFPLLFGTDHSISTIVEKVIFDDFVSAPIVWLPPAYLIKAWVYDYSMKEGLQKYWRDIQENSLLTKYWTIWVPAQTISFSIIPDHLRVAFMASVSFFWFILFSSVSHDEGPATDNAATAQMEPMPPDVKGSSLEQHQF
ncbi:Mpv17 / PMP22 family protein [Nitzschia inconspicua]|uniref:Mpv17 / PMP22 family protein n=1 Tax=Nitzschia inconspicua TaxID=303405 RepID=A0A9K3LZU0_9STRA|nr:Mpv17 / PMP22 family protein [Nitzschia inconspicua]